MRSNPQDNRGTHAIHGGWLGNGVITVPGSADWIVTKTTTGTYVVRFMTPFSVLPTVMASAAGFAVTYVVDRAQAWMQVNTYASNTPGTLMDSGVNFRCEGRR
jgi:hypothetical protein